MTLELHRMNNIMSAHGSSLDSLTELQHLALHAVLLCLRCQMTNSELVMGSIVAETMCEA